jgi:hypothetical protein
MLFSAALRNPSILSVMPKNALLHFDFFRIKYPSFYGHIEVWPISFHYQSTILTDSVRSVICHIPRLCMNNLYTLIDALTARLSDRFRSTMRQSVHLDILLQIYRYAKHEQTDLRRLIEPAHLVYLMYLCLTPKTTINEAAAKFLHTID